MQRVRDRIRELTERRRLLLPLEWIVEDLNRVLRGWGGYFRYENLARHFDKIRDYAHLRLALVVAKRHHHARGYGMWVVAYQSPNQSSLIHLEGKTECRR